MRRVGLCLRMAETLSRADGVPHVNVTPEPERVMRAVGADVLRISAAIESGMDTVLVTVEAAGA